MKKKALMTASLLGLIVFGLLSYRMESFSIDYPERIGYESFDRYSIFGIPFYQTKDFEKFPYDQEFQDIFELPIESATSQKRRPDYIKSLLGSIHKDYGYGWENRERRVILEAVYLEYRTTKQLSEAKEKVEVLYSLLPNDMQYMEENIYPELDALRVSLGLKPNLTNGANQTR
jgi:hypothetical protein|tara:strand:+ start:794 stop:1315 length:522 start_codon:yes stop_codon:yes gene_type:complete